MRGEGYLDFVVDVEPFRVVIHLLCLQGNPGHKAKRLIEIFEGELFVDGISLTQFRPPCCFQARNKLVPLLCRQPLCI